MLSYPNQGIRVPLQGIAGMDEPAARLSRVVEGAAQVAASLADVKDQVTSAGELADFVGRLQNIETDTRELLRGETVQDWAYAWNQTSEPMLREAIQELHPSSREAGKRLAELYNARACLTAQRDFLLESIEQARGQWQNRVDEAVDAGDADAAERWMHAGEELFVPAADMQSRVQEARSRSVLNRWRGALQQSPAEALAQLRREDAELPTEGEDCGELLELQQLKKQELLQTLAQEMSGRLEAGLLPERQSCENAVAAGFLTTEQAQAARLPGAPLTEQQFCDWFARVDECSPGNEAALRLEIASAPVPAEQRRILLQRLRGVEQLPYTLRRDCSAKLRSMYLSGRFGCPGDREAARQMLRLQESAMERLLRGARAEETERWLSSLPGAEEKWICYQAV